MDERRKYPRYEHAYEVRYASQGNLGVEGYTVSRNISKSGIRLPVSKFVKIGDLLKLDVNLNSKMGPVPALGRVVWTQTIRRPSPLQLDAGIQFTAIDSRDATRLVEAVA